jgi:amino acid adenylation domain-containing protein
MDVTSLVFDWNRASVDDRYIPPGSGETVAKIFEASTAKGPNRPAIFSENGQELSYQIVNEAASKISEKIVDVLTRQGAVIPTSCILVALPRSSSLPIALLACVKSGAAYCAVDLSLQSPQVVLKYVRLLKCPLAIVDAAVQQVLFPDSAMAGDKVAQIVVAGDGSVIRVDSEPTLTPAPVETAFCCPLGTMYIEFTSGSTGEPKAVAVPHSCCLSLVKNCHRAFLWDANTRSMLYHTVAFDVHVTDLWGPWAHGGCVVVLAVSLKDIKGVWDIGRRARATHLSMTPFGFSMFTMIHFQLRGPDDFKQLRSVILCGEALDFSSLRQWFAEDACPTFINGYGITETTVLNTYLVLSPHHVTWPSSIGRRLPHTTLLLLDGNLEPVPHGEAGEIYLSGDCVAHGYVTSIEKNDTSFLKTPPLYLQLFNAIAPEMPCSTIYKTGDLAHYSEEFGGIVFHGRADAEIKVAGFRVHPGEVEKTINQLTEVVKEAVVVPAKHPDGRTVIFCFLRPTRKTLEKHEVLAQIRQHLSDYKVPYFWFLDEEFKFPSTNSAKIDRTALKKMAEQRLVEHPG